MKIARWLALVPALVLASFVSAQTLGPPNFVTTGGGGSGGGSYTLPIAATGTLGGIKPDGTTITVNGSTGVASAVGGSGTVTHNGSLASGYLVIGGTNGTTDIKTDSAIQDDGAGTLTGFVSLTVGSFNVTGTSSFAAIDSTIAGSSSSTAGAFLEPSLANGNFVQLVLGSASTTNNCANIKFMQDASASTLSVQIQGDTSPAITFTKGGLVAIPGALNVTGISNLGGIQIPNGLGIGPQDLVSGHGYGLDVYDNTAAAGFQWATVTNGTAPVIALSKAAHGTLTIDGATIGGTTPGAGSFTTLSASTTPSFNTTGMAAGLSGTPALPNGTTATSQAINSGDTKVATDAYADRAGQAAFVGSWASPDTTAAVDTLTLTAPVTIIYTDPTAALRTYQLPAAAAGNKGMAVELIVAATQATYHVNFKPAASDVFYLAGAALTANHYVQDASTTKGDFIIGESDGVHWSFAFGTGYSGTSSWADAASP